MTTPETHYNVWELGHWQRIVATHSDPQEAQRIATTRTLQGRKTHVVAVDGSKFDRKLRTEAG